jgi:hypothetical protein
VPESGADVAAAPGPEDASRPPGGENDPWRALRRQQDRRRYLRMLAARPVAGAGRSTGGRGAREKLRRPNPAVGVPRDAHPLLGSPASMTRAPGNDPDQQDVRAYLRHSCDITMRGGSALGLVYPLAACALAEHYVFRRIAGSSTGAVPAALTAAAELGRGAPDPDPAPTTPAVVPGFAGLAQAIGWLAGADSTGPDGGAAAAPPQDAPDQHRLARMVRPAGRARGLFRVLVAALRAPGQPRLTAALQLIGAALTVPGPLARFLLALTWVGALAGWLTVTWSLIAGSRAGVVPDAVTVATSVVLLATAVLGAAFVTSATVTLAVVRRVQRDAAGLGFGLVAGVATGTGAAQGRRGVSERAAAWLDRRLGLPAAGDDAPALMDWIADRIDDLAGVPATGDALALTFGDLWCGSVAERSAADRELVPVAAVEREHRRIDLTLVATDLSERRPYRFPPPPADRAERAGGVRLLFCDTCLAAALPQRVVAQLVKSAPSTDTDHSCPRHDPGVLRELPEPWDLPVVFAVRLSCASPGVLSAVPLYTIGAGGGDGGTVSSPAGAAATGPSPIHAGGVQAGEGGSRLLRRPIASEPSSPVRTHWFADGGVTGNVPVSYFDTLLPRWPTFGLGVEQAAEVDPDHRGPAIRLPEQDAAPANRPVRLLRTGSGLLSAVVDAALGWRDAGQADLPGYRGRIALVRQATGERGKAFLLRDGDVLALALRGLAAGTALRERFTSSDGDVPGQTQTDRYRWIRLRMALREYRGMSLDIGARLPLYRDLASAYHVPAALGPWFDPPVPPAERDPIWADAVTVVTTLRAMTAGGVLDVDTDRGAPPIDPDLRLLPPE